MKAAVVLGMILALGTVGEDTKIGAGVTLADATPIASIVKAPQDYVGKVVRVDGVATAVCEAMGCWMAVADSDKAGAPTVRLKVDDDGAIKFPMSAKGRLVSAQGTFTAIGDDAHGKEAASEHAERDAQASKTYQIAATGAVIK
jgi:hypothetical protein